MIAAKAIAERFIAALTAGIVACLVLLGGGCAMMDGLVESDEAFEERREAEQAAGRASSQARKRNVFDLRRAAAASNIEFYTQTVTKPHRVVTRVVREKYVLEAESEADAELIAFYELMVAAAEAGGNALIEVKRAIFQDGTPLAVQPALNRGLNRGTADSTSVLLDRFTIDNYLRGVGTLSTRRLDKTFDRDGRRRKSVRFSGKAIVFVEPAT